MVRSNDTPPLLITGMPRSGTTWLARFLASSPRTALTGREPMNPRGRQYALAGTLPGWTRLESPTPKQRRALRTSYLGINPLTYSRYGHRQWAAPLPGFRIIMKDPFALLSIPVVHEVTGARPVLLFRHPGATLASYRRMGWTPDLEELAPIVSAFLQKHGDAVGVTPLPSHLEDDEVGATLWFWNVLYGMALHDVTDLGTCLILAHHDAAQGGEAFGQQLFKELGLEWNTSASQQLTAQGSPTRPTDATSLHNFDRQPAQVAHEWEGKILPEERARLEEGTAEVLSLLTANAYRLPA